MKYYYERQCDFHISDESLKSFIDLIKKLHPEKTLNFKATVFVYTFSSDSPGILEEPYSTVTEKFDSYEDFSSYYYSKKDKSSIVDISLPESVSVELNFYDKGNDFHPYTSIEINSTDDNNANTLLSFICDEQKKYPVKKTANKRKITEISEFINLETLNKLKDFEQDSKITLHRLIQFCDEINHNWKYKNYCSVGLLSRAIMHHSPTIFGYSTFDQFCNNYSFSAKSTKEVIKNLQNSQKHISDLINHETANSSNKIINEQMVDCRREINSLLQEILFQLSKKN